MTSEFCIAVHAVVYLNHKKCTVSSDALAENICTNPRRVRQIMTKLKKAGMVETKEGIDGGYLFCGDASALTLVDICRALSFHFVGSAWRSGDPDMDCLVASGMADIMDRIYKDLESVCEKHLEDITVQDIDGLIFSKTK